MKQIIHRGAAMLAFLCIATFFGSTVLVEILGSYEAIARVKSLILMPGIPILVLAMAATGGTGFALAKSRRGKLIEAKKKRMPFIAANGVLILIPCAFVLDGFASAGTFDRTFYTVQGLEVIAGFVNLVLMSMNIRDGFKVSGRFRKPARKASNKLET